MEREYVENVTFRILLMTMETRGRLYETPYQTFFSQGRSRHHFGCCRRTHFADRMA
jgi:hypothetical protein